MMNNQVYGLLKTAAGLSGHNYPEQMGRMMVVNTPWVFNAVWSMCKGWIDEKTRNNIEILGSNGPAKLLEWVDKDTLPTFLGGNNETELYEDRGPWSDWEVVDSTEKDAVVGVRKIGEDKIFSL